MVLTPRTAWSLRNYRQRGSGWYTRPWRGVREWLMVPFSKRLGVGTVGDSFSVAKVTELLNSAPGE
jgi:hypothetical protein